MNDNQFRPVWTPDDFSEFRRIVTAIRAAHAADRDTIAPVIDIRTRERIA